MKFESADVPEGNSETNPAAWHRYFRRSLAIGLRKHRKNGDRNKARSLLERWRSQPGDLFKKEPIRHCGKREPKQEPSKPRSELGEIVFTVSVVALPLIGIVLYQGVGRTISNLDQSIIGQVILVLIGVALFVGFLYVAAIPLACVVIPLAHWIERRNAKRAKTISIEFVFKADPRTDNGQGELFLNDRSLGRFECAAKAEEHVLNRRPSSGFSWVAMQATFNGKLIPGGVWVDE